MPQPPTLPHELQNALDGEDKARFLEVAREQFDAEDIINVGKSDLVALRGKWVADLFAGRIHDLKDWLARARTQDAQEFGVEAPDFNEAFWRHPPQLYHASPAQNADSIARDGLQARCETRSICNRRLGAAVFATTEHEELADGAYGENIYAVDTAAMKRDGLTPEASLEPDAEDAAQMEALATLLGHDQYQHYVEEGISRNTVIFRGGIPAKYVTLGLTLERVSMPPLRTPRISPQLER